MQWWLKDKQLGKQKKKDYYNSLFCGWIKNITKVLNVYYNSVNTIDNIRKKNKMLVEKNQTKKNFLKNI